MQILSQPERLLLHRKWCFTFSSLPGYTPDMPRSVYSGFLIADEPLESKTIKGFMREGKGSIGGDRPCENCQIEGDLLPIESGIVNRTYFQGTENEAHLSLVSYEEADHRGYTTWVWGLFLANTSVGTPHSITYSEHGYAFYYELTVLDISYSKHTVTVREYHTQTNLKTGYCVTLRDRTETFDYRPYRRTNPVLCRASAVPYCGVSSWSEPDSVSAYFANEFSSCFHNTHPFNMQGDLCQAAVDGTRAININTFMYLKEAMEMGSMIKSTIDSAMNLKRDPVKELANLYLSWHYGYRLTYKDTKEIVEKVNSELRKIRRDWAASRARGHETITYPSNSPFAGSTAEWTFAAKVWYRQYNDIIAPIVNTLYRWDLVPELGNIYDLVPYSFVIDWFVPLGDVLDKIDSAYYAMTLRVGEVWYSDKIDMLTDLNAPFLRAYFRGYESIGPVRIKYYMRWRDSELSYPKLELSFSGQFHSWIPAGALILQRKR